MPALLKGFLEQIYRPSFTRASDSHFAKKLLSGCSARVVVTMGTPALVYRWYFRAHSLKSLERDILGMVGIAPVHETLIGLTGDMKPVDAAKWLTKLKRPKLKKYGTMRLSENVVEYFKGMADEAGVPYQNLINLYLRDCLSNSRKVQINRPPAV